MTRKSWEQYFMDLAVKASERATCDRLHVGCILVDTRNHPISTGYNGAQSGMPHCDEIGHLYVDGRCKRTIHAERNAIDAALFHPDPEIAVHLEKANLLRLKGSTAYITDEPCEDCSKRLYEFGVARIVFKREYKNGKEHPYKTLMKWEHFAGDKE